MSLSLTISEILGQLELHKGNSRVNEVRIRSLASLKKGDTGRVLDLTGTGPVVARLQELGMIRGAELHVVEILTFGEPIIVDVDQVRLALRKSEARCVTLTDGSGIT